MNYKDFNKVSLGYSDIASLVFRGPKTLTEIKFGEDGHYNAYFVTEEIDIPSHYTLVAESETWGKIYDDDSMVLSVYADKISIYRAGEMGILIYAPNGHFR